MNFLLEIGDTLGADLLGAVIGIILSVIALSKNQSRGLSIAGIITSIVGGILSILAVVLILITLAELDIYDPDDFPLFIKGGLEGTIAGASNGSGFSGTVASAVRGGASGAVSGGRRGFERGMDFNAGTHLRDKQFK